MQLLAGEDVVLFKFKFDAGRFETVTGNPHVQRVRRAIGDQRRAVRSKLRKISEHHPRQMGIGNRVRLKARQGHPHKRIVSIAGIDLDITEPEPAFRIIFNVMPGDRHGHAA